MITQKEANHLTCQEAAKLPYHIETEDRETFDIIMEKTLIHMAAKDEVELLIDEKGEFLIKLKV